MKTHERLTALRSASFPAALSAVAPPLWRTRFCPRWLPHAWLAAALVGGAVLVTAPLDSQAAEALRKVRSESPSATAQLQQQGARLVADYGSFQILTAPPATVAPFAAAGTVVPADNLDVIELNAGPLRTSRSQVQALRQTLSTFKGQRLHLVQFAGPVKPEWHADLVASGAKIVAYVPNNAYLVYGDATALGRVQALTATASPVQWEGAYRDEYKLHPKVRLTDEKGQPRKLAGDLFAIQMVADPAANAATLAVIDARKLAAVLKQEKVLNYLNVIVRLPADALAVLAAQPEVVSIRPYVLPKKRDERQGQIVAGNLSGIFPSGPGYLAWLVSKGFAQGQFAASGFAVDVTDSGLDNATATPGHFGLYPLGNTSLPSRVAYNRLVGTPHTNSTLQGCDGHGTLNSHIIAGYNDFTGFPFTDAAGFSYGLGIAPFVRVGSSVIFDPDSFTSPSYSDLQSQAYRDGARISSNSWGSDSGGDYDTDCQEYDALVRDAQPDGSAVPAPGNQEMVIVFSAGNAGPENGTAGSPGSAKNVIGVGAAENVHSHSIANGGSTAGGDDGCGVSDLGADSANDIISFSSRGPCADGRKKPDLVGPGTHVTGGVGQGPVLDPLGSALDCFSAEGVCALWGGAGVGNTNNFFPLGQQFYTTSSGTSHSCPAVAGGVALVRQWFINHSQTPPSPALTKAWLLNSARYLDGDGANDTLPSNSQGMGGMNLGMAFDDAARVVLEQSSTNKFTASGQMRAVTGAVKDPSRPVRITLAWTDAPGSTTGNAYNNNLDLVVTMGGQTYRGNVFNGAYSTTGGSADPRNNVESVFLPAGVTGNFAVTVTAANIVSDGVPNDADPLDQDFALVIYNAETREAAVIAPGSAALTAENCAPGNGAVDPGEIVSVAFTLQNIGTVPSTNLVATLLPVGGVLSPSSPQNYGAIPSGGPGVAKSFAFQAVGACGGSITCTLWLTDGGADLGTVTFPLTLGVKIHASATFAQPGEITIPEQGKAAPYPSALSVAGLAGKVSKVTATVYGFSHTYPGDVDVLLVGPTGQSTMLLSRTGDEAAEDADLTFDDAAATRVTSPIVSGTYQPTSSGSSTLPPPAPARPYGTTLAAFLGTTPNGTWQLFVNDRSTGDSGLISGGWSLTVVTEASECCYNSSQADVGVTVQAQPSPVTWENDLTYTLMITNQGLATATGVLLTNRLPEQVSYVSSQTSQGTVTYDAGVVTASLGALASGAAATVQIVATVNSGFRLTNHVAVSTETFDYDPSNNEATTVTTGLAPVLGLSSQVFLVAEGCVPANGAIDPGEQVTVNLVVQNTGTRKTTNVVVTLLPTGGVTSPSGAMNYGALRPGGPPVTNAFSFTVSTETACGGLVLATFAATDNAAPLLAINHSLRVGRPVPEVVLTENFDGVTAPALPVGWTTASGGYGPAWETTTDAADTLPNSVFVADPPIASYQQLISPSVMASAGTQLTFRHSYDTEEYYDTGWLEISIAGGDFTDILEAGGSFVSGGYNTFDWYWSGDSGGFITTVVNLPEAAAGQSVQLRWCFFSDYATGGVGWYVDSIALIGAYACCLPDDLALTGAASLGSVLVGQELTYTLGVTNSGPATATGVTLSNCLPAGVTFISATASQGTWSRTGDWVVADLGSLASETGAGLAITVKPTAAGTLTNQACVRRDGTEAYLLNNTVQLTTPAALPTTNFTFQAPAPVIIPESGTGIPYPAPLIVSGVAGTVTKVTATLNNFSHTYPSDLDILLVGPGGESAMLMAACGSEYNVVNATLTFDDQALLLLSDYLPITSGTYQPTDYAFGDSLPEPAPEGPYDSSLATFQNVNPNGVWNLFIYDFFKPDAGRLAGGWSLAITTTVPFSPHRPVASSFTLGVPVGGSATVGVIGKYVTDADVGDILTVTAVSSPTNGTAVIVGGTNITYTSTRSAASDSFTYTVSDGYNTSTGTVTVITYSAEGFNQLSAPFMTNGMLRFSYMGIPNFRYALEQAESLAVPVMWQALETNAAAANGLLLFDIVPSATNGASYFRTRYVAP
jgi:uncharacterized repeat protein (TIGR01451 family)